MHMGYSGPGTTQASSAGGRGFGAGFPGLTVPSVWGCQYSGTSVDQPAFEWSGRWANMTEYPHYGQPTRFDFDWEVFGAAGA